MLASIASTSFVDTWRLPPRSVGSPARMPVALASNTRAFFAGLFGLAFRTSFVPAMGWPAPGGMVVVVVADPHGPKPPGVMLALLVGLGQASAKLLENISMPVRVRLMVPSPGVAVAAGLPSGCAVPSYGP